MKWKAFGELMFLITCIAFMIISIIGVGWYFSKAFYCGNHWFFESAAIHAVQVNHPEYVRVVEVDRNIYDLSRLLVETKDGKRRTFCIDSDILVNLDMSDPDGEDCLDL